MERIKIKHNTLGDTRAATKVPTFYEFEDANKDHANDVGSVLASLPSAQPEIVYCKECICGHGEVWLNGNGSADFYGYCGRTQLRVLPYDYCSYAKRRTDESD